MLKAIWIMAAAFLSLAGCAPLTTLGDGRPSGMTAENNALHESLPVSSAVPPLTLSYRGGLTCNYAEALEIFGKPKTDRRLVVTTRRAADKVLVVLTRDGGDPETFLIGKTGHLYDYNAESLLNKGRRTTTESAQRDGLETIAMTRQNRPIMGTPHAINEFTLLMPEFAGTQMRPGDVVATTVTMDDQQILALYRFMGITTYKGAPAALFDLTRIMPALASRGPILVGFDVVDLRSGMPLLTVMDAGSHRRDEQLSCGG